MPSATPTIVLLPMWAPGHFSSMLEAGKRLLLCFFGTPLLDVAHDPAVPAYVYFASTGAMLALMLRLPAIHEEITTSWSSRGKKGPGVVDVVDVPGMPPVLVASMPSPVVNDYAWFAYYGRRFLEARGIVVNTAAELEPGVLAAIAGGRCTCAAPGGHAPPMVYPIGPVLSPKPPRVDDAAAQECIRWLDAQPPASVVFLCFGSMGWMSAEQAREVAAGLERGEHRFLWVLRGPPAAGSSSGYPTDADLGDLLPDGFLERTEGKGLVWPIWAPQKEILAHAAVGGFVTHGGWNSVLESLWHGVPMAPWPLYAEQPLNAFELVACMGVAVELRRRVVCTGMTGRDDDSFVEAVELERAIWSLMGGSEEGRKAREKATEMKAACRNTVEKGGSAYAAMQALVQDMLQRHVPGGPAPK